MSHVLGTRDFHLQVNESGLVRLESLEESGDVIGQVRRFFWLSWNIAGTAFQDARILSGFVSKVGDIYEVLLP